MCDQIENSSIWNSSIVCVRSKHLGMRVAYRCATDSELSTNSINVTFQIDSTDLPSAIKVFMFCE